MVEYKLIINFKEEDLRKIAKTEQKVVLIKRNDSSNNLIVWATFRPWQRNIIMWENKFAVYATNDIQKGEIINKLAEKCAFPGVEYDLEYGYFVKSENIEECEESNAYFIKHTMEGYKKIAVGLAQSIFINGQWFNNNPINACSVFFNNLVSLIPKEEIEIYLAADVSNSLMLSSSLGEAFVLKVDEDVDTVEYSISYNGETGEFFKC